MTRQRIGIDPSGTAIICAVCEGNYIVGAGDRLLAKSIKQGYDLLV
jgi:hypothetical protein